ncbi:hypothetical protein QYF36_000135 [Acer negundo]|nr:hypothetical protein QYF36_000135 [Acer negundo]
MSRYMVCDPVDLLVNRVENSILYFGIVGLPIKNLLSLGRLFEGTIGFSLWIQLGSTTEDNIICMNHEVGAFFALTKRIAKDGRC